ncbi:MAG: hypothetical protein AABY22_32350 [Nanoarchaeota archaeon]
MIGDSKEEAKKRLCCPNGTLHRFIDDSEFIMDNEGKYYWHDKDKCTKCDYIGEQYPKGGCYRSFDRQHKIEHTRHESNGLFYKQEACLACGQTYSTPILK